MAQATRTFRIFVSSTFSDLKEERNALQRDVFPKLRDLCRQHGCRFQAIDLRWGVREEAALDQQTMKICLDEIERCRKTSPRPNFIILLGDRYGWRPIPAQIEAGEFEAILDKVSEAGRELLLWGDAQPADLKGWYRRDNNAVPPEYCLRPREVKIPDGTSDEEKKVAHEKEEQEWSLTEQRLRSILLGVIDQLGWGRDDPRWNKYTASATEQEIVQGALNIPDAPEHIFGFFRTVKNLPHDETAKAFVDLDASGKLDEDTRTRQNELKQALRELLPGNVHDYEAEWTGSGTSIDHIPKLCEDVFQALSRIIEEQIARLEEINSLDKEIADHKSFGNERIQFFIGRADILRTLSDSVQGTERNLLAVVGEPGSGKSALMAKSAEQACSNHPHAAVIVRFIGATPGSSDCRALLASLCRQISREYNAGQATLPTDYKALVDEFPRCLALSTAKKPLILFLDALDQLSNADNARNLVWLPANLPEHVCLIVSTLPGECEAVLRRKRPPSQLVTLEKMTPDEGSTLLGFWLTHAHRRLQDHQLQEALGRFECSGMPLYLKLAFDEVRLWKSYADLEETKLQEGIPDLIRENLFRRLASPANHGKLMVSHSLGYLAASRYGLSEDELLDLLSADNEVLQDFTERARHEPPEKRLPVVVWSRLYFDLEPYLTEHGADGISLLAFYHGQLKRAAEMAYFKDGEGLMRHSALATYFRDKADPAHDRTWTGNYPRGLSELPYHQTQGGMWEELERTLCDVTFVAAKCVAGMTYDLVDDCDAAIAALSHGRVARESELELDECAARYARELIEYARGCSEDRNKSRGRVIMFRRSRRSGRRELPELPSVSLPSSGKRGDDISRPQAESVPLERIRAFCRFVRAQSHLLSRYRSVSGFGIQQACNFASGGPVTEAADALLANAKEPPWMLLRQRNRRPALNDRPACLLILQGHTNSVRAVAIQPDGRRAISGGDDEEMRLWDLESGRCLQILAGHTSAIHALAISTDGRLALSGSADTTLRLWDLESGACLRVLTGHEDSVDALSMTPDGLRALSGSADATLRVWDLESGRSKVIGSGHPGGVRAVALTANGERGLSGGNDAKLRLWDLETGKSLHVFDLAGDEALATSMTPDGRLGVSGSGGTWVHEGAVSKQMPGRVEKVHVWDLESGQCLRALHAGSSALSVYEFPVVSAVAITADGRCAVSASTDRTLRVWDLNSGLCVRVFEGHSDAVESASITPDGRRAVTGSADQTIRVWDLAGTTTASAVGDINWTCSVVVTPDGRRALWQTQDSSTLAVWDVASGERLGTLSGHSEWVLDMCVTPDGSQVVSGGIDRTLRVWDIETRQCVKVLRGHTDRVLGVVVTPDGRRALSSSADQMLRVWNLQSGKCLRTLEGPSSVRSIAVTPDGRRAIASSTDTLHVWDLESGRCLQIMEQPFDLMLRRCRIIVSPDGRQAVSDRHGSLLVWDLGSGQCVRTLKGHRNSVLTKAMLPDGCRMLSGGEDRTLRLWDLESGECLRVFKGHTSAVKAVTVVQDGCVAVSRDDKTLRLWDIDTGSCLALFPSPADIRTMAVGSQSVVLGTATGEFTVLETTRPLLTIAPQVTGSRIWLYGSDDGPGRWEDQIGVSCPWCGRRSPLTLNVVVQTRAESGLNISCPASDCGQPLRLNPFICDPSR